MKQCVGVLITMICIGAVASAQSTQPAGQASREHRDRLIAKARQRMAQDRTKYEPHQLKECEDLYQVANKNWRSDESRTCLKVMIEKYPDVNRTGCAALYLAQYERDPAVQERLLKDVIEKYGDCWYGNGAQVGALARFHLAGSCLSRGESAAAQKLFDEINRDYPGAITHQGVLLAERIKQVQSQISPGTQPAQRPPDSP
jgi:hypothetical protein